MSKTNNPKGVAARRHERDTTPLGLKKMTHFSQGSSFLATLGWTQSRWNCRRLRAAGNSASRDSKPIEFERFGNYGEFAIIKSLANEMSLILIPSNSMELEIKLADKFIQPRVYRKS